jgi:hypothetical protein
MTRPTVSISACASLYLSRFQHGLGLLAVLCSTLSLTRSCLGFAPSLVTRLSQAPPRAAHFGSTCTGSRPPFVGREQHVPWLALHGTDGYSGGHLVRCVASLKQISNKINSLSSKHLLDCLKFTC